MNGRKDNLIPLSQDDLESEAALYALGVLDTESASRFEELLTQDAAAVAALKQYQSAAALVAESLNPVVPPARVKQRLFETIGTASAGNANEPHEDGLGSVRSHEGNWKPTGIPGITSKKLYFDRASGLLTTLVRMEPGAVYPAHRHTRTEQCLILEGDVTHHGQTYHPGDFTWAEAGTIDPSLETVNGNVLLIITGIDKETPA